MLPASLTAYLTRRTITIVGALVVLVAVYFLFFRGGNSSLQTLVVHRGDFVQQLSVSGTVQAAHDVDLGFAQSGRVSATYVSVGDRVTSGEVLAEIENGDLRAAVAQKKAALASAQAQLASLQAGTRPEQLAVTQSQVQSDGVALAQAAQGLVNAIQNAYTQSDDAVHNKVDQFFSNPRSLTPQLSFPVSDSSLKSKVESDRIAIEPVLAAWQGSSANLSVSADLSAAQNEAQHDLAEVSQLLIDANAALNAAVPASQTSASTIQGWITNVATARANVNTALSTLNTAITSQQSASATLSKDEKTLALEQAGSTSEDIQAQQAQVQAAQADVQNAQAQLQKTLVVAPFSGTVTRMDAKEGETISPTEPKISLISDGLYEIETYVPEVEITGLSVGNAASTTLDAYGPDVPFAATVISIDPAETVVNGVATYKTTLQFLAQDDRIKSGMTAEVVITTQITHDALAVPQGAVFDKAGQKMLQLVRDGAVVDVPVQTGAASKIGNVQIVSGIADGDTVVLNPDTTR
jgi:HlyD family secretion protein